MVKMKLKTLEKFHFVNMPKTFDDLRLKNKLTEFCIRNLRNLVLFDNYTGPRGLVIM